MVGYARVSTDDQNTAAQVAVLKDAGCERTFREKACGGHWDRPNSDPNIWTFGMDKTHSQFPPPRILECRHYGRARFPRRTMEGIHPSLIRRTEEAVIDFLLHIALVHESV